MKKRILALFMALLMIFGFNTSALAAGSPVGDNTPDGSLENPYWLTVNWGGENRWTMEMENVCGDADEVMYRVHVSNEDGYTDHTYAFAYPEDDEVVLCSVASMIEEDGVYYVDVEAEVYEYDEEGNICNTTYYYGHPEGGQEYKHPNKYLATPTIVLKDDFLYFGAVEGALYYEFDILLKSEDSDTGYVKWGFGGALATPEGGEFDLKTGFAGFTMVEDFYFSVRAITENIDEIQGSKTSEIVGPYELKLSDETKQMIKDELDTALESDNPVDTKIVLSNYTSETIASLAQEDVDFAKKFADADEAYKAVVDYKEPVSTSEKVDVSKVTIVGAALNAGENEEVQLTFADAETDVELEEYENAVALDIKLMVNGESMSELSVPITITMPIPDGVSTEDLVILHYHQDGKEPSKIVPVINEDGTMTFTVTGFSTFIVANEININDNDNTGDNNTGDNNTGDNNTGDNNTGDNNAGDNNTANNNTDDKQNTNNSGKSSPDTADASIIGALFVMVIAMGCGFALKRKQN